MLYWMEIWFDDDLKDARFQGFFEVARSVGWLARLWITLVNKFSTLPNFLILFKFSNILYKLL
jgi:hypothetical protein